MKEIQAKEIMMPVLVLWEGCANCERLDIQVRTEKLYGDDLLLTTINHLACTSIHECKRYAELVRKAMNDEI